MNKQARNSALIGLLLITAISQAFAQGTAFTYQGHLTVATTPANGNFDLTFTLYDAATAGNIVAGPLTNASVAVSNGLFTTVLDFGSSAFNGADRWLQISVGTNGSATFFDLSPLQKLTAAPYSIYSANASLAGTANAVAPGAVTGSGVAPNTIAAGNIASGQLVKSLNGLTDAITLSAGTNVTLTSAGNNIQISANSSNAWNLSGNSGTSAGTNYLGTADNQPLEFKVNGQRALRLEPTTNTPNVIGGFSGNFAITNAVGATIAGGGMPGAANSVDDPISMFGTRVAFFPALFATVSGGAGNAVEGSSYSTIGGGLGNVINSPSRPSQKNVIAGGNGNSILDSNDSTISGGVGNGIANNVIYSTIGGGTGNSVAGLIDGVNGGTISGGSGNRIGEDCDLTTIGGGGFNQIGTFSIAATIGGGHSNVVGGYSQGSTIAGGEDNIIRGASPGTVIGGGFGNQVFAAANVGPVCATVAGGDNNLINVSGTNSTIGGGLSNLVSAAFGTIPGGSRAAVKSYGQLAYASGAFANAGDAQTSTYVCRGTTTDATTNELFLDGASLRLVVPTNSTWAFDALITARAPGGNSAGYQVRGVIKNNAGTASLVGAVTKSVLGQDVDPWDATVVADNTNQALSVRVSGGPGTTIRWVASVRTTEVGY
jgi:hypothetical protein